MPVRADFERLRGELAACIADVVELAGGSDGEAGAGGQTAAAWRALVDATTTSPPLPLAGEAANAAEVRAVLLAVQAHYDRRLRAVECALDRDDDTLVDAVWELRHRRLDSLVSDEVAAYLRLVAPRPSVAALFANRAASASATGGPSVQLHRCATCGAPRRAERLYGTCLYCGALVFQERSE